MKKKAIKIAASTAVAASAFVAVAPAQQADAATNVTTLATNAQNAGTVLKWAISYEGSADFATRPFNEFNAAKKAVAAAEAAAAKLSTTEKLSLQAKLVDAKIQIVRATAYIDAITSSEKIKSLTSNLNAAIATGDLGKVETAYHAASFEYKKQAKLLDRVYGQSTRDGIRNAVKPAMEAALEAVKYDVTVKMHIDKASALIKEGKLEEAAAELAKADYNLTLKDAKFTFKTQLQKSFDDAAVSLPLQAISAVGDGANTVTVKFSKAYTLDKTLTTLEAGQFKINGLTVQSAKLSEDKKSVVLTTSTQKANTEYTVTWQGKSVSFKTAAVADTSGIAVNETDVAYVEATDSRTYNVKLTNTDGTPYVGRVTVDLNKVSEITGAVTGTSSAVITSVNGLPITTPATHSWTGVTDSNGNLVFTIAAAYNSNADTTSVTYVEPKLSKLDGDKKTKTAAVTHFFQLQSANTIQELSVTDLYVSAANDYVYAEGKKYKWDANDAFFIRGQKVSQEAFETALSDGDTLTVDYKASATNVSTWNITVDVTKSANTGFTNPKADVRFDGFNYDLSGKGQAGNTVKVYRGSDLMGTTTVNADGTWTLKAVNLTQDSANKFEAFQYAPGKDGYKGTNAESATPATRTIFEGAFASTGITLTDKGDNGLSVTDELTFSFLNNPGFAHEFKEDLTGTITVSDGLSKTAVFDVEYVDADTLKIVKVVSAQDGFKNASTTLTIEATTGVVNQDELAYNVAVSKSSKGSATIGAVPVSNVNTGLLTLAPTASAIVVDGTVYGLNSTTALKNAAGTTIAVGGTDVAAGLGLGDQVSVSGNVVTLINTAGEILVAKNVNTAIANSTLTPATLTLADKATVDGLEAQFDGLTANQQTYVTAANKAKLNALVAKLADLEAPGAALQAAITAVNNAATTGNKTALITALSNSHFTGYDAANNDAYFADRASFAALTTDTAINGAIVASNAKAAYTAVDAAATASIKADLIAALADDNFTGYNSANNDAYFAKVTDFAAVTSVADVNTIIATVNVAQAIPTTFAATGLANATVVPVVPAGYSITSNTSSAPIVYGLDGTVLTAGTSTVKYTVTHTVSGKTAVSNDVNVTVAITTP